MNTKEIREAAEKCMYGALREGSYTKALWHLHSLLDPATVLALCDAADENKRLRKDLGAALVSGMQGDAHAVKEIAAGYKIEFPDGAPVANTPEADDE